MKFDWSELKKNLARRIAPEYIGVLERSLAEKKQADSDLIEEMALQRYTEFVSKMDPFEPLMRQFHGIFSQEFERVEQGMNEKARLLFLAWAHGQYNDPNFQYLMDWISNKQGNETLKHAPVTPERILYGRAQISCVSLIMKEVGRLSLVYEDEMKKLRGEGIGIEEGETVG